MPSTVHLAWGAKVSHEFALRVIQMGKDFSIPPDWPMACMAFESGLNPKAHNPHSSATGLIQFMEATAQHYGVTTAELAAMTAEKQFDYVWLYFRDAIKAYGPLKSLADCYMAILCPAAIGHPDDTALWVNGQSAYAVNAGLDANKDHKITKAEAAARVSAKLLEGLGPTNAADIDVGASAPAVKQEPTVMSKITDAFHFVFDHVFANAARQAATLNPDVAAAGIATVTTTPIPATGSPNSTAGQSNPIIQKLEDDINALVMSFVKSSVDQLPVVGGIAQMTGLDNDAANAAKAMLVFGEQHALTYMSAIFSGHHAAVNSATGNGAA
jgi:hypothetical protein